MKKQYKSYEKAIRQLKKNCKVEYPDDLTVTSLLEWRKNVVDKSISPVTWNSYIRQLKTIFKFGIEYEILSLEKNPFNKLSVKEGKHRKKIYSPEQLQKLSCGIQENANIPEYLRPTWFVQTIIMTLRCTAIRRTQLIKLKIKDVDLEKRIIYIPPEINKNHDYHTLPISNALYPYLTNLLNKLQELKQSTDNQLFNLNLFSRAVKRRGKPMTADQVSYLFKVISKYTGITSSPHRFRHTAATNLMRNPENLYITKQLLGHKDIRVTLSDIEHDIEAVRKYVNSL
ncbi:tyrosine-type recombinase/integrase [[Haemophilus] ducreyi]|uniref:Integrase/recombinase n=1 Tax=Haemophilus ducreyi (strain 35000HP / ATCC 700724) TaxID=233412 RepID=Q7VMS2_HAEDU|nr:site-specific integrase [[Haemophilus] ducreyi]AAP95781.1 integrase/recombinase [[Haemophilus] ducreyi 35000HP]